MKLDKTQAIYVIYNPEFNITKVGIAHNVQRRKYDLQTSCGCNLIVHYHTTHIFDASIYEAKAHKKLADKRKMGEWFNVSPEDAAVVVREVIWDAKKDPIIEAYTNNEPISQIAQRCCVTRQAILSRIKEYGCYPCCTPENIPEVKGSTEKEERPLIRHLSLNNNDQPTLPLKNLKRIEPNISFNGEWYQISVFKDGEFNYAYARDITKAREYVKQTKQAL